MTLTMLMFILFIDIIIILFALETNIYSSIIFSIKKIFPQIIIVFVILAPIYTMGLLVNICNFILLNISEQYNLQITNDRNVLIKLLHYGIDIINYSPFVLLLLSFLFQPELISEKNIIDVEIIDEIEIKNIRLEYKRLNLSIIFNCIAIIILIIFFIFDIYITKRNFPIEIFDYLKNNNILNILKNIEEEIHINLVFIMCLLFYYIIFKISQIFIVNIIEKDKRVPKIFKYLIFLPLINILFIIKINKFMKKSRSRKYGI